MKKLISFIICISLLLLAGGCAKATPVSKTVSTDSLAEYTIIYPSNYSEWKMSEVTMLKSVLEHITGKEISAKPDTEEATGKEIILASSSRNTKYSARIFSFANAMCYVVGFDGDNIVLGGQNFYSDMRAIYDFINNYLGYDDLTDKYSEITSIKTEEKEVLWQEPNLYIMGSNFSCDAYTAPYQIKDFADANFNLLQIIYDNYNEAEKQALNVAKWCARFGIQLLYFPCTNWSTQKVEIPNEEDMIENPAVFGLYIVDEPSTDEACELYSNVLNDSKKRFSKYGWTIYVNTCCATTPDDIERGAGNVFENSWKKYFSHSDALSFDAYMVHMLDSSQYSVYAWQNWQDVAKELNQEFYVYIDAYNLQNRYPNQNTLKMFRSQAYLAYCFDAQMIEYFQYGDASRNYTREGSWGYGSCINYDYSKNSYYYDAQEANADILFADKLLEGYVNIGVKTYNPQSRKIGVMKAPCDKIDSHLSIADNPDNQTVLAAYYENGDGKEAFILMNLEELTKYIDLPDDEPFMSGDTWYCFKQTPDGETELVVDYLMPTLTIRTNGKPTCYQNQKELPVTDNGDGTYTIPFSNGACITVIIE